MDYERVVLRRRVRDRWGWDGGFNGVGLISLVILVIGVFYCFILILLS